MNSSQEPLLVQKVFNSTGIDLLKLRKTAEWSTILRMMRVSNDITFSPGLNFLMSFSPKSAHLDVIRNGIHWHLLRWNSGVAAEALTEVIEPLQKTSNQKNNQIWCLIQQTPSLTEAWDKLQKYLTTDEHQEHLKSAKFVRDKLLAHYDRSPIDKAFSDLLDLHQQAGHDVVVGWHMQTSNDGGQLTRNNLIDQLVNIAWHQAYGIQAGINGPDPAQLQRVSSSIEEFLSLVSNFVHGLVIAYCEHHDLLNLDGEPPWITKDRE